MSTATETAAPTSSARLCDEIVMSVAEEIARNLAEYRSLIERLASEKAGREDTPERILGLLRKTGVTLNEFHANIKNGPGTISTCLDPELVNCLKEESADLDHQRNKICQRLYEIRDEPNYSQEQLGYLLSEDPHLADRFRHGDPETMNWQDKEGWERKLKNDIEQFTRECAELPATNAELIRAVENIKKFIGTLYVHL